MNEALLASAQLASGIIQGFAGFTAKNSQANQYDSAGATLEAEHMREANRIEDEGKRFAADQKMAYIGSGVEIGGSATVTLAQTDAWAKAEAESVRSRGRALRSYNERSGRIARSQGRASFISGVAGGLSKAMSTYASTRPVKSGSNDPTVSGYNPPTRSQAMRPGAFTRIRP